MQGKLPEDFQSVKGQKNEESSNGIFGAILKALQTDEDESGKNLLGVTFTGEDESNEENKDNSKTLVSLSALTSPMQGEKVEVVDSEVKVQVSENLENEEADLENDQPNSQKHESGQLSKEVVDQSSQNLGENSDGHVTKNLEDVTKNSENTNSDLKSADNNSKEKKETEGNSDRVVVSESDLDRKNESDESNQVKASQTNLDSDSGKEAGNTPQVDDEFKSTVHVRNESNENKVSEKSEPVISRKTKTGDYQKTETISEVKPESTAVGIESADAGDGKMVSNGKRTVSPDIERSSLQAREERLSPINDSGQKRSGEPLLSTEKGEMRRLTPLNNEGKKSMEQAPDITAEKVVRSGSVGAAEVSVASAAVNMNSVNVDRLRAEKESKTSERISNTLPLNNQTRSRGSSENDTSRQLFQFSGSLDSGNLNISPEEDSSEESFIFWNRLGYEGSESIDEKKSNGLLQGLTRLGQIPITNTTIRKQLLNGIAQTVQKSAAGGKTGETWQKHTFSLENGKNIQISVRQIEGVLHLKLGSTQHELTKLLQMHQQDIKDHLQKEFDLEVDLEFNQQDDSSSSDWFDAMNGQKPASRGYQSSSDGVHENGIKGQGSGRTVRNFGYNQMEWTA